MIRKGKQNRHSGQDFGLRKSIPFRLSSILKATNRIEEKVTLAQVSQQYESQKQNWTKRPVNPLIKANNQKDKNTVLFLKNYKPQTHQEDTKTLKHCKSSFLNVSKQQNFEECIEQKDEEEIEAKLMDLISLIHEDKKKPLNRCHSSASLFFKPSKTPLILNKKKTDDEIFLPQPNTSCYRHDTLNQDNEKLTMIENCSWQYSGYKQRQTKENKRPLVNSTYFNCKTPKDSKITQKRMSHYVSIKKAQNQQLCLCINCETYVDKNLTRQHEKKCIGFSTILRMKKTQLIDFLNEKINTKLNQLREIQTSIKPSTKNIQKAKNTVDFSLYEEKKRIDQILTDLDLIRLKALKRFHVKNV